MSTKKVVYNMYNSTPCTNYRKTRIPLRISPERDSTFALRLFKTAATYSPTLAVPSARSGLTSLFGMGRGGTPTL